MAAATRHPGGVVVFAQPLGTLFAAAALRAYVPVGINVPLSERIDLVVEITGTAGQWYGCGSRSSGGWAAAGLAWFVRPREWLSRGLFLQPKMIGRHFSTGGSETRPVSLVSAGCSDADVDNIDGRDYELHVGLDLGYSMRIGIVEFVPLIGASVGLCQNCFGGGVFFMGDFEFTDTYFVPPGPRATRLSIGLNLNVARLGIRF